MPIKYVNKAVTNLDELLSFHDKDFIRVAYQTLLGRAPDLDGANYYLARMQSGTSKLDILKQISLGQEAKALSVKLVGLDDAIQRQKWLKIPFIGGLLGLTTGNKTKQQYDDVIKNKNLSNVTDLIEPDVHFKGTNIADLMEAHGLSVNILPHDLTLEVIEFLNPLYHFDNIYQAISIIVQQSPIHKISIYEENEANSRFYIQLALNAEIAGRHDHAIELYRLSILFTNTPIAHEHLGNLALNYGAYSQALAHFKTALSLNNQSHWVYLNLAKTQRLTGQYKEAVKTICKGIKEYPAKDLFISCLDEYIEAYWDIENQNLECVAVTQNREQLIFEYDRAVTFISSQYANVFKTNSIKTVTNRLNKNRVLIIGLPHDVLPQCFRYRIEQKLEQLKYAGYVAETIPWYAHETALNLINFYDLVIFYRPPAFPSVLKLVEYAKSLGKITFYELDDLLFEEISIPPIETYGGKISLSTYINLIKDIGSYRAIASKCDYAIASTLPLLEKLAPLVQTQIGYLHRNGLDKYSWRGRVLSVDKEHINLFYGSGTLAHNSDFIIEALPAITRILREYKEVKLTIMGHLTLPDKFLFEFKDKVQLVPFVKDIEIYLAYLSLSDINLAVLHDDPINACKSELKWFEAATYSIPSVVSLTKNYLDVIKHGVDGFVVTGEHEWYSTLKELIINHELRRSVGKNACERVNLEYSVAALAANIDDIINCAVTERNNNIGSNK